MGRDKHQTGSVSSNPLETTGERDRPTVWAMGGKRRTELGRGRYDPLEVAHRIDRLRLKRRLSIKEVAICVWPHQGDGARHSYSKKNARRGSDWSIEEIGVVADLLSAPPGWPFIDDATAAGLERLLAANKH